MSNKLVTGLIHIVMLAIVCAIGAYWGVRILTPQPTPAPPPIAAPVPREPDPVLAARMFGLIQQAQARVAANIQVAGIFAAGKSSSAVLVVDGKPPRAYVVGQEVVPGTRLAEVTADAVVLEADGNRQELQAPPRPMAQMSTGAPSPAFIMERNVLSAPPSAGGSSPAPVFSPPPNMPPPQQPGMAPGVPLRQGAPGTPADTYVPGQQPPQPAQPAPPQG